MYVKRAGYWMVAAAAYVMAGSAASADTLELALVQAYQNNPQVNAQRALVRATDENVPQALAGYRPRISGTYNNGVTWTDSLTEVQVPVRNADRPDGRHRRPARQRCRHASSRRPIGGTVTQTLFNGFQTGNRTRQAEAQVFSARETLRVIEQTVLLDAATAYMNVLRDSAIYDLQKRNVEVLQEQLRQTRDRFNVGEVTRTDVAQAESRVAAGAVADADRAGQSHHVARRLSPRHRSRSRQARRRALRSTAFRRARSIWPWRRARRKIRRSMPPNTASTSRSCRCKVNEGSLYPTVTITGSAQQRYQPSDNALRQMDASVIGQLTVPIYQGGSEYSLIRQAKETVGQRRLELAVNRDQARANVVQAWGQLDAAKAQIDATKSQVTAAEIALNGVREEARVGQRTTLDVLNAQQELVNARVALVTAQRDRVVASYALLSACGRLSIPVLGLQVPLYDPMVHYQQVRDSLDRNPYPGRALTVRGLRNSAFVIHIVHKSYLPRTHGLQYSLTGPKTAIVVL